MHLDQRCSSAISLELKRSGSFPLTHSSTAVTTSSSDRKWSPRISFFKFGNRKKSLGARSGEYAGCGINSYPFRSTASIATLQVWTLALSCCSKTPLESLPRFFRRMAVLSWSNKFAKYTPVIVLLLGKNIQHNNAFCVPKYRGHHLASRWLRLELLWPWGPRPYPLTTEFYSLAHNNEPKSHLQSQDAKEKSSFDLKRFNKALHTDALVAICSSLRTLGTQRAVGLRIPKRSCKIVETLPCEMPNACAISSTGIRLSGYTRFRTFLHISSSVASSGRSDLASSPKDVLPRLNSPTQNLTWA